MTLTGRSLVGSSPGTAEGSLFHAVNPATGEEIDPPFTTATMEDVERAAQLADDAFGVYAFVGGREKGEFLRRIAEKLEASGEALVQRAHLETALPGPRLQSELGRTTGQLRLFAALVEEGSWPRPRIDRGDAARKPVPKPDVRSMRRPLGPVAVFGASNFPLAFSVPGGDTVSALASGCPVIVKAHPSHPGTAELAAAAIAEAVRESSLPEGVFSLLFDSGHEIGAALVQHPLVRAVAFTGSRRGGLALMELAGRRREPIPLFAEMGSINPVFILPGALRSRGAEIAAGLDASVTMGVGQFCTNPGLLLVQRGDPASGMLERLTTLLEARAPETMLNATICEAYHSGVARFSKTEGVKTDVSVAGARETSAGAALFTTDARTFLSNEHLMDEVFGPASLVVEWSSRDDLFELVRSLEGQLTVTLHATEDDLEEYADLVRLLETKGGRILFNGYPTGVEVCHAMVHGGPFPATSDGRSTSVGTLAIERFTRLVAYQNAPDSVLPLELKDANPLGIRRMIDGKVV
ncbi:MAG: aldehyde dehydrogenase (NADP(+)) [Thermoanaerobaculia bacterium]